MPARDNLEAQGAVIEVLGRDAFRVELPNGHRCIARPERNVPQSPVLGDSVRVAFHPYDLSRGRIVETSATVVTSG